MTSSFAADVVYSLAPGSTEFFAINPQTGSLRLVRDLEETNKTRFDIEVAASDGTWKDWMVLHLKVVEENLYAPAFLQEEYMVEVLESVDAGTTLEVQLEATDQDSTQLTYDIQSGNDGNLFRLDLFSGRCSARLNVGNVHFTPDLEFHPL